MPLERTFSGRRIMKKICFILAPFVLFSIMTFTNTQEGVSQTMKLISQNFVNQGAIPKKYTCDGKDISPALKWTDAPEETKSFALIMDDPDAPDPAAPKMTWVHWVLYNLPSTADSLAEGILSNELPEGTLEGLNDWKKTGYGGPCPPIGKHRYFYKLYALDIVLPEIGFPLKEKLEKAMEGHVLSQAELVGLYQRK